jgi:hypothetical protein
MKVTFKQFNKFVETEDDQLAEQQLDEIWPFTDPKKKAEDEKNKRDALAKLRQKQIDDRKALSAAKDKQMQDTKDKIAKAAGIAAQPNNVKKAGPMNAATARAAEQDWVRGMANESVMNDTVISKMVQGLITGLSPAQKRAIIKNYNQPEPLHFGKFEADRAKVMRDVYDVVTKNNPNKTDNRIHNALLKHFNEKEKV